MLSVQLQKYAKSETPGVEPSSHEQISEVNLMDSEVWEPLI